jgi:hypothetical protein
MSSGLTVSDISSTIVSPSSSVRSNDWGKTENVLSAKLAVFVINKKTMFQNIIYFTALVSIFENNEKLYMLIWGVQYTYTTNYQVYLSSDNLAIKSLPFNHRAPVVKLLTRQPNRLSSGLQECPCSGL